MIAITKDVAINEKEIELSFVRSRGPGGQHVNKVSTAVQLRFDVERSPSLSEEVRHRLKRLAGKRRMTMEGVLVIEARRYRSQQRNREDALERFVTLVRKATEPPKKRRRTKPSRDAVKRRLVEKRRRSDVKKNRQTVRQTD